MEINIDNAILHILDTTATVPVFSREKLDLDDRVSEFIEGHIERFFDDQSVKPGKFMESSKIKDIVSNLGDNFLETSIQLGEYMYKIMVRFTEIPSGDLLVSTLSIDDQKYLAIIKFNYKEGYTHYVDYGDNGTQNKIVVNKTMFPSGRQRDIEGALINLEDLSIKIYEREYSIEGEKFPYFSEMFLVCNTDLSIKESIKVINKVAKDITEKYYDDDFEKISQIKEAIYDNLGEGVIQIDNVAETIFSNSPQVKREYIATVKDAGVDEIVDLEGIRPEKKLGVHKIKTDNGIKLDIPVDIYRNKDIVELLNNPDGTISIVIKNISKIRQGS